MEVAGFIIAIVSFFGSIVGFILYDKKLNKQQIQLNEQQKIINDYQIKVIAQSEAEERKAEMDCNIIKGDKGNREVRFFNKGKSVARNVRVIVLNEDSLVYRNEWGPYEAITPQGFRKEQIALCTGHQDVMKIKIMWDDDYESNRETVVYPPL